ncbi:MAG TPA: helix-turn-helix domain-containing protein [Streptosporangiaceae bacterium]
MAARPPDLGGTSAREQLSALRSLLVLFMLLTQQDSQTSILHFVANAVKPLCHCTAQGIFLDGEWRDIWPAGREDRPTGTPVIISANFSDDSDDSMQVELAGVPWSYAYSLGSAHEPSGYLVVGAEQPPGDVERFLLQLLAQQAGVALSNVRSLNRERDQATELRAANLALSRSMEVHETLTRVALGGQGQDGLAVAMHKLTGRAVAIEDRFGNLRAWAGPGRPHPYPKATPAKQDRLLRRMMAASRPIRSGERLCWVALLGGIPVGVLVLQDPDGTAGDTECMALEHAGTVLAAEIARMQTVAETDAHLRANLVLDLIADTRPDPDTMLNRAQVLGYDLARPHRVLLVAAARNRDDIGLLLHAVSRAVRQVRVGSLLAPRLRDVIVLADHEAPWEDFRQVVAAGLQDAASRVGVGGRYDATSGVSRSFREAQLALQMQKTIGGPEQVTIFSELGVYQLLAASSDMSSVEEFVQQWLGPLTDYDNVHGTQLVLTLSEYLDHGGSYAASATALSVHRSTLKYRLRRIREVSGYDLGVPDTVFNLQLATRAWRTLHALRQS